MSNLIYGQEGPGDGGHSRPVLIDNQRRLVVTGDATGGPNGDGAIIGQIDSVGGVAIEPGPGIGSAASSFPAARQ